MHRPPGSPCMHRPPGSPCMHWPPGSPCMHRPPGSPCMHRPPGSPCMHWPPGSPCMHRPPGSPCMHRPMHACHFNPRRFNKCKRGKSCVALRTLDVVSAGQEAHLAGQSFPSIPSSSSPSSRRRAVAHSSSRASGPVITSHQAQSTPAHQYIFSDSSKIWASSSAPAGLGDSLVTRCCAVNV